MEQTVRIIEVATMWSRSALFTHYALQLTIQTYQNMLLHVFIAVEIKVIC